jgi:predicted nucleic acid-binding protein
LAEILYIAKKGRTSLGFTVTVAKIEALANFEIAPLDLDVLKIAESIDAPLEMHYKLIAATAIRYNACLITRDEQITKSRVVKTIW